MRRCKHAVGKILVILFTALRVGGALPAFSGQTGTILEKIDRFRVPYTEFLIRTRITTYHNDQIRESALFDAYISGEEKSLVLQKEGKNRDMKILYREEKLWVSLPGSSRPLRITPIQRLMGQASNGDVARIGWASDYTAEQEGEGSVEGVPCLHLRLTARRPSSTYAAVELWVRKGDLRPVKGSFYLASGKLIKTVTYDAYEPFGDTEILKRMTITDMIKSSDYTVFTYEKIEETSIPAQYYNKNYLVHVKGL
ncbi:outer membrane lipoprotein-sorting protein [bacterium]|nr:outer membrane lipoprotein-sorting protein [bacterium]